MFGARVASWLPVMALAVVTALVAQDLPKIEGDSLAGHRVVLPDAVRADSELVYPGGAHGAAKAMTLQKTPAIKPTIAYTRAPTLNADPGPMRLR